MSRAPRARSRSGLLLPLVIPILLAVLAACGGGGSDPEVASLAGASSSAGAGPGGSATATGSGEQEALDYISCLRKQGLDVPDPTVNADGSLSLVPPTGAGGTPGQGGGPDQAALQKAIDACGNPPDSLTGGFGDVDRTALQDAALKFAQCMRGKGYDVADPDFSGGAGPGAGGGLLDNLDRNDPKTQADLRVCQKAFSDAGITLPGQS